MMRKVLVGSVVVVALLALPASRALANAAQHGEEDTIFGAFPDVTPATEQYENRAYPAVYIEPARRVQGLTAAQQADSRRERKKAGWRAIGPVTPFVPAINTYSGRDTVTSGRVTSIAVSPSCDARQCQVLVGAAGGGVWVTDNGLARRPAWRPSSTGLTSNSIGSIAFDPTDRKGRTLYVGTGEPNGSSDSEAGVGLFRSTDSGATWSLLPGSVAVAAERAIASVAVDPADSRHLLVGTAVARHGSSSVNGGRYTPPGAPPIGLYESRDGGATFQLALALTSDVVDPGSPNGSDFFRGGVSKIVLDRTGLAKGQPTRIFASFFDYGVYRSSPADEGGDASYKAIFASAGGGTVANSLAARTEFALAPGAGGLRIYVGDAGGGPADFWRADEARVPASALTDGVANIGWTQLSDSTPGTPGFGSYDFCGGQCSYDMVVESPPGRPDLVWLGGQMLYDEIFGPSNGRAVIRSSDAGVHFTDMTNDAQTPYPLGMHPDQHAMAFAPGNPDVAFCGSDGGVVRTSGDFADASAGCAARGLTGADLVDCQAWLKSIPARIDTLNDGLNTLQFQSLSLNAQDPLHDLLGGTQDNGTWSWSGTQKSWFESMQGDGGQSGTDVATPNVRMHTFYNPSPDVNFQGTDPLGWDWTGDVLGTEAASFYVPLINDPRVSGTWFIGQQRVWRTQDNGGDRAFLDQYCNEYTGDYANRPHPCGDWEPLGSSTLTGGAYGTTKGGSYVVAIARARTDSTTMWVATRRGRLFVSINAGAPAASVSFTRVDTDAQPTRFISGIAVDPRNPFHAWVSFSGYDAYTPATPGHVFEVLYDGTSQTAAWTDLSHDLGDQPITGIARDDRTGDLYVSTDFGVLTLDGGQWEPAARGLPPVAVYGLTIDSPARVVYAATHGRGAYQLRLDAD